MHRVEDTMDYHRVKIGDGEFLLPESSKMNILFFDGKESRNETHYSDCREYARANDLVHGRILRLEQFVSPSPRWVVEIRFNRIEHNGVEQALDVRPVGG